MPQTIAIILNIGEGNTETFEQLFEQEILPLWHEFVSEGKLLAASLTPVEEGDYPGPAGFRYYILHVEMPGMTEHSAFDGDPRFLDFLSRAKKLQPEEPFVWFGTTLYQVP
jgi:hypothetical protein